MSLPSATNTLVLPVQYCSQGHPYDHGPIMIDAVKIRMLLKKTEVYKVRENRLFFRQE